VTVTDQELTRQDERDTKAEGVAFSAAIPLHHRIAKLLRQRLKESEPDIGAVPVTEQRLSEEFGVSRSTVRLALQELKREGLVTIRRGVGTRAVALASTPPHVRSSGDPLHADLGTTIRIVSLDRVAPRSVVADFLELGPAEPAVRVVRIHELDGSPLSVVVSWLHPAFGADLTKETVGSKPLHTAIEQRAGSPLRRSVHGVRVARADAWIAHLLGVPLAEPVLYISARASLADGRAARWTDNYFCEDRYEYEAQIEWPEN
jgi:DNA-binding GntR family transcriptional regulator